MDAGLVLDARRRRSGCARGGASRRATWSPSATRKTAAQGIFVQTHLGAARRGSATRSPSCRAKCRAKSRSTTRTWRGVLIEEKERGGYPIWVTGPALVHSRARSDMSWFIANGYVGALLAGNAVAVHDIEASIYGTTLGMTQHRRDHAGRPRAAHARHQPGARRGLDRQRRASRASSPTASCTRA